MKNPAPESKRVISRKDPLPARMGSYEILSRLAEGGMGTVYYARHSILGGVAAVKVIKSQRRDSAKLVKRFQAEAQALARVKHQNVVQVLDVGEDDGHVFIAMELAPGMDLGRWIKRDGALPAASLNHIAMQLIEGIAAAHEAGVLHRDIKPDNVIVDQLGGVKISDFGLADDARIASGGLEKQTFATVAYAAPEVLEGRHSDARSDVFSLAATLWHVALGELPFGKGTRAQVMAKQVAGLPQGKEALAALPPNLAKAILAGLATRPAERPESASELYDLAFPANAAQKPWAIWAGAASLLLCLGFGAAMMFGGGEQTKTPTPLGAEQKTSNDKTPTKTQEPDQPKSQVQAPNASSLSPERQALATKEWAALQIEVDALGGDAPRELGMLQRFIAKTKGTAEAEAAAQRFSALAAVFERQRKKAFASLEADFKKAVTTGEKHAALEAFPLRFQRRVSGLDEAIPRAFETMRTSTQASQVEEAKTNLRQARALLKTGKVLDCLALLQGTSADEAALERDAEAKLATLYVEALSEDEAYLQTLRAARERRIATLEKRLSQTSLRVWRGGPRADDASEASAIASSAQELGGDFRAAWTKDLKTREAAYESFATYLKTQSGEEISVLGDPDQAPQIGIASTDSLARLGEVKDGAVTLIPVNGDPWRLTPLRSLGVERWLKFAISDPAKGTNPLAMRVAQVEDSSVRTAWVRRIRRDLPGFEALTPLAHSTTILKNAREALNEASNRPWRGAAEDAKTLGDAEINTRRFVLDATSGVLELSSLMRARHLAPKSFRVARALARFDLERPIAEKDRAGLDDFLAKASQRWQDRALWSWAQKSGK